MFIDVLYKVTIYQTVKALASAILWSFFSVNYTTVYIFNNAAFSLAGFQYPVIQ